MSGRGTSRGFQGWVGAAAAGWLVLSAAGCSSQSPGHMVAIPPPSGWHESLTQLREQKDEYFRTDENSPLIAAEIPDFKGLEYWDPDPAFYFVGQVNMYLDPEEFEIPTTAGQLRRCARVGWVGFRLDGVDHRLQVYQMLDQSAVTGGAGYFLPFMDATTGTETYPAGRYLDLVGPEGGPFVLDFNNASNPWCAYGSPERYACPVTPPENRLPVRVEAGERGYHRGSEDEVGG